MRLVCHDCIWALLVIFSQPFSLQERFRLGDEVVLMESRRANHSADAPTVQTILRTAEVCICKALQRANHFADAQAADLGTVQTGQLMDFWMKPNAGKQVRRKRCADLRSVPKKRIQKDPKILKLMGSKIVISLYLKRQATCALTHFALAPCKMHENVAPCKCWSI